MLKQHEIKSRSIVVMSSNADKEIFQASVEPYDNVVLFKDKKNVYITDNSSNGGSFNSQLQFDLQNLSSQSNWVSLKEAVIQFPIKQTITNTGSGSQTPSQLGIQSATLKNGFHQMIDSVQLVVDGNTVQTSQIYKNIDTQFKILKTWSKDTENKYGPSIGWGLDRNQTLDTNSTSLGNLTLGTIAPSGLGVSNTNVSANMPNLGVKERLDILNIDTTSFQATTLGNNAFAVGLPQVDTTGGAIAQGSDCFCQFVLATVRLRDICPFVEEMPLTRNLRGFLYINYNAFTSTVVSNASGAITSISHNSIYGRTHPGMLRLEDNTDSQSFYPSKSVAATWTLKTEISGIKSTGCPDANPTINYARLSVPYYQSNPAIDQVLSQKKTFRYLEYQVSEFDLEANASKTITLTPGIAGAQSVLLVPFYTAINGTTVTPWQSCFDSCPATTSPMAKLKDLQVLVGNVPVFANPITMSADMFLQEIAQNGIEGGEVNELASGLLSQKLVNEWYCYNYVNIARRMDVDDGCSRSVMVQCGNATSLPMRVLAFVHYQKEVTIDTNTAQIYQGRL